MEWTEEVIRETVAEVGRRSAEDAAFRSLCLSDATAAIAQVTDLAIPDSFTVRFVSNEGANLTVVLPDPVSAGSELSDAELEQVAGGKGSAPARPSSPAVFSPAALTAVAPLKASAALTCVAPLTTVAPFRP